MSIYVNSVSLAFEFAGQATKVSEQFWFHFSDNQGLAIFCAEDHMGQKVREGSAHSMPPLPGLGSVVGCVPTAHAVGY